MKLQRFAQGVAEWTCLLLVVVLMCGSSAFAQTAQTPESYRNIDEFGVDLSTGTFNFSLNELQGGTASTGIDVARTWGQAGWIDTKAGFIKQSTSTSVTVVRGSTSETFTLSGGVWVPAKANGTKLTRNMLGKFPLFSYTAADGTVVYYWTVGRAVFTPDDSVPTRYTVSGVGPCQITTVQVVATTSQFCASPTTITEPNGHQIQLSWDEESDCFYNGTAPAGYQCSVRYRLRGIHDLAGYQAEYEYSYSNWYQRTGATLTDLSTGNSTSSTYSVPTSGTQQVVDQYGGTWTIVFGTYGRITSITRPGASSASTTVSYGTDGKVSSVTKDGVTKTYTWSTSSGNDVVAVSGGASGSATVTTNPSIGQPGTVTNATSNSVQNYYDSNNRLWKTVMPEGNYVQFTYDARGNITGTSFVPKSGSGLSTVTTSANYPSSCTNTLTCNQPDYTIDERGNRTDYTYSSAHGGVTRIQLPAPASGQPRPEVNYTYSSLYAQEKDYTGTLVSVAYPQYKVTQITACATAATCAGTANETRVTIAYDTPNLQVSSVTVAAGDGSVSATTAYTYDANDNLATVDGPVAGSDDTEYYFYDGVNRPIGTIGPDPDAGGSQQRPASRISYDTAGRVTKVERGTASGTSASNLTSMTVYATVETAYDANGRKATVTVKGANGSALSLVQYGYDSAGRPECTAVRMNPPVYGSLPSSACSQGTAGSYGPDRITRLYYDSNGRVTRQESGVGATEVGDDYVLTYTTNGEVATARDGEANLTTYEYDGFDRLAKKRLPVATRGANSSSTTDYEQYGYDAASNLTSLRTRAAETLSYAYDNLGRLVTKTVPARSGLSSTHTRDVYYGYDLLGRPSYARFDSTSGEGIAFVFDALGRMTSTTQAMDSTSRTLSYLYDAAGRRTRMTWPDSGYVAYAYDTAGKPTTITDSGSATLRSYAYDSAGRPTGETMGASAMTGSFTYDSTGRLATLGRDLSGSSYDVTDTFTWQPSGQLASESRSNDVYAWTGHANVDRNYTANGLNQYATVASISYGYDANGNLTSDGTYTYSYDVENRMVGTSGSPAPALRYDPLGRIYELAVGSAVTRFLYDGADLVAEYDGSNNLLRRYAHATGSGDDPVAWYEGSTISSSTRRFLHADRLGSIVSVVGDNGTVIATNTYDEYGIPNPANAGRFQYTGQAWVPELGIYYYKARMYSPTLGRFMQTDPIGYADGMNWYNYVGSDPVNGVDPSGNKLCTGSRIDHKPEFDCNEIFSGEGSSNGPNVKGSFVISTGSGHRGSSTSNSGGSCAIDKTFTGISVCAHLLPGVLGNQIADFSGQIGPQSGPCAVPGPRNVLNKAIAEANAKRLDSLRRINEAIRNFGTKEAYPIVQGINIETSLWFIERVRTGGVWDFKNQPGTRGNQDFGNFAFGATGDALGYGDFSHVGADLYSLYDNGTFEDQDAMIDRGQAYYRNGCQGR